MIKPIPIIAFVIVTTATALSGQDAVQVARKAFPSTVLIISNDSNGQQVSLGSGFVVAPGVVATNYHVIEGAASATVKLIGERATYKVDHIHNIDAYNDLALLSVSGLKAPAVSIGRSATLEVGATVYAIGNPRGLEGSFSHGIVSARRQVEGGSLLQITAPISLGSSGGPVLDASGKVVGVSVATYKGGQNLNFAIPSSALSILATKPDQQTKFPVGTSKVKGTKTILGELGANKILEGVTGSNMQWDGNMSGSLGQGNFTVSARNTLNKPISNVKGLVIIHDKNGQPLDFTVVTYRDVIPPKLSKRLNGRFDTSVVNITTSVSRKNQFKYELTPNTNVEFRVLYFDINE